MINLEFWQDFLNNNKNQICRFWLLIAIEDMIAVLDPQFEHLD